MEEMKKCPLLSVITSAQSLAVNASHSTYYWDRIKGLKLRQIDAYCGGAAVHEVPQHTREKHSLSCTAAAIYIAAMATVDEPQ